LKIWCSDASWTPLVIYSWDLVYQILSKVWLHLIAQMISNWLLYLFKKGLLIYLNVKFRLNDSVLKIWYFKTLFLVHLVFKCSYFLRLHDQNYFRLVRQLDQNFFKLARLLNQHFFRLVRQLNLNFFQQARLLNQSFFQLVKQLLAKHY
jgi:hypothetical protein